MSEKFRDWIVTETPLHQQCDLWIVLWDPRGRGVCPSAPLFPSLHKIPREYWCAVTSSWNVPTHLSDIWEDECRRVVSAQTKFSFHWKAGYLGIIHQHWPLLLCSFPPAKRAGRVVVRQRQEQGICGYWCCGCGAKYLLWRSSVCGVVSQHACVEIPSKVSRIRDCWAASEKGGCVLRGVGLYRAEQLSHGAAGLADAGQRCEM